MKRILFSLFMAAMAVVAGARTYVLVTGVSNYGNDANNLH